MRGKRDLTPTVALEEVNFVMTQSCKSWCWKLGLASCLAVGGAIASSFDCAKAQITPDGTLGAEHSVVTRSGSSDVIEGGATRGRNLFHSFEQFSVPTNGEAHFNNSPAIQNIISRVTGLSVSNIDGLIRANGTANLFLLNPNGIIFGRNASLDIRGSFVASTARAVKFADGTQFSATAPQTTPLLTISMPLGLQFGSTSGSILNKSQATDSSGQTVGLQVQPGKTLALVGGDIALEGGSLTSPGGRIELGSVAGPSLVSLTPIDKGWSLGYEGVQNFQDIKLSQGAEVDASGSGGGDIQVQGRRVTLTDGSQIDASTRGSEPGGTLAVSALESVEVTGTDNNPIPNPSALLATVYSGATGAGGNVTLKTGRLILRDGGQIGTQTDGQGDAGILDVTATESVEVISEAKNGSSISGLFSQSGSKFSDTTAPPATGNAGKLRINTRQLIVQDGTVSVATFARGNGGNLEVNAHNLVVEGGGSIRATVRDTAIGSGGKIGIKTGRLLLRDGGKILASTSNVGNAGAIAVSADTISLSGSDTGILSSVNSAAVGSGGSIFIETGS